MSTPTIVLAFVSGSAGGQAPFPVFVKLDIDDAGSVTGAGEWKDGYCEWQVVNDDGSVLDSGSWITATHPVLGTTVRLDRDQRGFNAGHLFLAAGTYKFRCRFTNQAGERTSYAETASVTVAARTGTALYVDGARPDDSGNGLSWAAAKQTWPAAVALVNSTGNNTVLYARNCNCATSTTITADNVWLTKDPAEGTVTVTLTANVNAVATAGSTDGLVVSDLTFAGSASGTKRVCSGTASVTAANVCFYRVALGANMDSMFIGATGAINNGLGFINCDASLGHTSEFLYHTGVTGLTVFGNDISPGSSGEHTIRLTNTDPPTNRYHAIEYNWLSNPAAKGALRWLAGGPVYVGGNDIEAAVYHGFISGSGPQFGEQWVYEANNMHRRSGQASGFSLQIYSGWPHGSIRDNLFDDFGIAFSDSEHPASIDDTVILNNVFKVTLGGYVPITFLTSLDFDVTNLVIKNNLFTGTAGLTSSLAWIRVRDLVVTTGWAFSGNVFERNTTHRVLTDQDTVNTDVQYTYAQYTVLGFVSGELRQDTVTINATTLEPADLAVKINGVASAPFPHVSYNGVRYNSAESYFASGAWRDDSDGGIFAILNASSPPYNTIGDSYNGWIRAGTGTVTVETIDGRRCGRITTAAGVGTGTLNFFKHTDTITIVSETDLNVSEGYSHVYLQFGATYSAAEPVLRWVNTAGNVMMEIRRNAAGNLLVYDAGLALIGTTTLVVANSEWVRIECRVVSGSGTSGEITVRFYHTDPDSATVEETITSTSCDTTAANVERVEVGKGANRNSAATNVAFRDFVFATGNWVGDAGGVVVWQCFPTADGDDADMTGTAPANYTNLNADPPTTATSFLRTTGVLNEGETPTCAAAGTPPATTGGVLRGIKIAATTMNAEVGSGAVTIAYRTAPAGTTYESDSFVTTGDTQQRIAQCWLPTDIGSPTLATVLATQQAGLLENSESIDSRVYDVGVQVVYTRGPSTPGGGGGIDWLLYMG